MYGEWEIEDESCAVTPPGDPNEPSDPPAPIGEWEEVRKGRCRTYATRWSIPSLDNCCISAEASAFVHGRRILVTPHQYPLFMVLLLDGGLSTISDYH